MRVDFISRYSTSSSKLSNDVAEKKKKFQNVTEDDRQQTSLSKNSMSRSVMSSSSILRRSRDLILDDIFDRNAATNVAKSFNSFSNSSFLSENESNIDLRSKIIVKRKRSKSSSSSSSHRKTRSNRKDDDRSNYRDFHEEINFVDFKSHSHMNRVLVALSIDDSLELDFSHMSESRFYKKARKSNE